MALLEQQYTAELSCLEPAQESRSALAYRRIDQSTLLLYSDNVLRWLPALFELRTHIKHIHLYRGGRMQMVKEIEDVQARASLVSLCWMRAIQTALDDSSCSTVDVRNRYCNEQDLSSCCRCLSLYRHFRLGSRQVCV